MPSPVGHTSTLPPVRIDPDRRSSDRDRDRGAILTGLLALLACASALIDPSSVEPAAISEVLGGILLYVWTALYGLGGALIVVGNVLRRTDFEEPGLRLFLAGMATNVVAIFVVRSPATALLTLAPYAMFAWLAVSRVRELRALRSAVSSERRRPSDPLAVALPVALTIGATTVDPLLSILLAVLGGGAVSAAVAFVGQRKAARDVKRLTEAQTAKLREEAGATVDERWQRYAESLERQRDELRAEMAGLISRMTALERRESECEARAAALARRVAELEAA